jgi:hypothetical protein
LKGYIQINAPTKCISKQQTDQPFTYSCAEYLAMHHHSYRKDDEILSRYLPLPFHYQMASITLKATEVPVGAASPTRSQLISLKRQLGTHAKLKLAATSQPQALVSQCISDQPMSTFHVLTG